MGTNILAANEAIAAENREAFCKNGSYAVNLVSSPGSGKTTLLERTIEALKERLSMGVIEGDIATSADADRIRQHGIPAVQINTGGGCHLDAFMVSKALAALDLAMLDLVLIENVGNLVCPAAFDLGEAAKIAIVSVTEGDDKPLKYPALFRGAEAFVINKIDLVPYTDCDVSQLRANGLTINPKLLVFETSCRTGEGLGAWYAWLEEGARAWMKNNG
ncbi:MAG: hydrogenase nickel incorporation protein HypB [Dehalococcoidales bacterium]|nr:hydrogenase nickel incorporation protein HypB [Dehalococcoidales bacterium]